MTNWSNDLWTWLEKCHTAVLTLFTCYNHAWLPKIPTFDLAVVFKIHLAQSDRARASDALSLSQSKHWWRNCGWMCNLRTLKSLFGVFWLSTYRHHFGSPPLTPPPQKPRVDECCALCGAVECGLGLACTTWVMILSSTERLQHAWPAGNTDSLCAAPSVAVAIRKFGTGSTSPALMLSGCIREKCWIQGH